MKHVSFLCLVTCIFICIHYTSVVYNAPFVTTKLGIIRGLRADDGEYAMFLGIPYAMVNKTNPFGNALPISYFEATLEAYDDTTMCPQQEEFNQTISGDLDCLTLNIFVPNTATPDNKLPVLVHIYGGDFKIGFAGRYLYGPKYLVRHDIIFVTVNFRVGPYGFLCLDVPNVSGNQGLKDLRLALRWIRDKIEAFSGDAAKITASGHSSGAVSLDLLLHSINPSEKLFNKVIVQSGTSYFPDITKHTNNTPLFLLARQLGLKTDDVDEALTFLSVADARSVISSSVECDMIFKCCIEKRFKDVDHLITDYPINLKIPAVENMSIMIGNTDNERVYMYENRKPEYFDNFQVFRDELNNNFDFEHNDLTTTEEIVRRYYIGDEKIGESSKDGIIHFSSDFYYVHPIQRNMLKYIDNGAKNVFYYMFTYDGKRNFLKSRFNITKPGASHADELGYLFDMSFMDRRPNVEDQLMIDRMTTLWANFIKYGNPTPQISELLPARWEPFTKQSRNYLQIDNELSLKTGPFSERMAFWDLFYKINGKLQKGYRTEEHN